MTTAMQTCYRHPDRRAGVSCQRCDRPVCPSCMQQASVGFHCPECAKGGRQKVITARTLGQLDRPIVTQVLIAINVAVFVLAITQPGANAFDGGGRVTSDYGLIGSFQVRGVTIPGFGVAEGEWWRLLTSGFLHGGIIHLGFNMFALWMLGQQLEPALGKLQFGVVYFTSLLGGALGVMVLSPHDLTVGASGAIFGLFGVALAGQLANRVNIWDSGLGGILLINLLFTFGVDGISIGGHLGGLGAGFLCGVVLYRLTPKLRSTVVPTLLCVGLGLVFTVGAVVAAGAGA